MYRIEPARLSIGGQGPSVRWRRGSQHYGIDMSRPQLDAWRAGLASQTLIPEVGSK